MSVIAQLCGRAKGLVESVSGENLKAKVFRGGAWLGSASVAEQAVRFGRSVLLARLLVPQAFGLMAIVASTTSVLHTITDIGVKEGLIQHPSGDQAEYATAAWWLAFGRSLLLYAIFFSAAPLVSRVYGEPRLTALMRVATLGVIFDGIYSSHAYVALKKMKFSKWALVNGGGGICGVVVTIVLGFLMRNVWALVIGSLSESFFRCAFSYVVFPYCPSLRWTRGALRELLGFSKGLFGLSFLNLLFARTDVFVLGKLFSAAELGIYVMGIYLVQTPANYAINTMGQTLLPTYSQIQSEPERTNRILIRSTGTLALFGFPLFIFVCLSGRSLLTTILGERYAAASVPLVVCTLVCLVNIMNAQITTVFYSRGVPQLHRTCVLLMAAIVICLIYPMAMWLGIAGGQVACLGAVAVGYLFQVSRARKVTGLKLIEYWKPFAPPLIASLAVGSISFAVRDVPELARPLPNIMFGITTCIAAFGFTLLYIFRSTLGLSFSTQHYD